jgi:hypothetical protein
MFHGFSAGLRTVLFYPPGAGKGAVYLLKKDGEVFEALRAS